VAAHPWDQRLARAEHLAREYEFAQALLDFYRRVAHFQRAVFAALRVDRVGAGEWWRDRLIAEAASALLPHVPALLTLVERVGPAPLATRAAELRRAGEVHWTKLLADTCAGDVDGPADARDRFFARAMAQPYAERCRLAAARAAGPPQGPPGGSASGARCPWCRARPVVGVLRQEHYGARRSLFCSLCAAEWDVPRVLCVACGETEADRLLVSTADRFPHVRVDACETCRRYLKAVDLTRDGLADPLVDELATVPLDLWAAEQGYRKLQPNLLEL
jgi:FdhE protein